MCCEFGWMSGGGACCDEYGLGYKEESPRIADMNGIGAGLASPLGC